MSNRVDQPTADLEEHLTEQIQFLDRSAAAFDSGFKGEAKRLATTIRVLLHDAPRSRSLLGQLGKKDDPFVDSAYRRNPGSVTTYCGLTVLEMGAGRGRCVAMLDSTLDGQVRRVPFSVWWDATVIVDKTGQRFTRKDLVLAMANQDGGAHVDPALDEDYARLTRANSLAWYHVPRSGAIVSITGVVHGAVRQIAHEVLRTLNPGYAKKIPPRPGTVQIGDVALAEVGRRMGRNEPCSCGSGKKFKRCCGRP
ncbi:MAG: SEC-C domain-containing protein [Planctomycetes bacterium]|nr:SEC-C domain-containing protein [Planctomycetota bacterium]